MYSKVILYTHTHTGFSGGLVVKNLPVNGGDAGDMGLIPGLGRSPGVGNRTHSNILAWKIPRDRGAWWSAGGGLSFLICYKCFLIFLGMAS